MLCVTLGALAAMAGEALRGKGPRMPVGWFGIIGLAGAAISAVILWNPTPEAFREDFGVIVADNFGLFVTLVLALVGILTDHVFVAGHSSRQSPGGRILRAPAVLHCRHDDDGDGHRSPGDLRRPRDPVARGLCADRDPARGSGRHRGGVQVLPARRHLQRVLPVRHCVHLRRHGQHADCRRSRSTSRRSR